MDEPQLYPEHTFVEEIYLCPTQVYYFFSDKLQRRWCAYIRQRRQPYATFELVQTDEFQDFLPDSSFIKPPLERFQEFAPDHYFIPLSRQYDINKRTQSETIAEITAMEQDVMIFLRANFPDLDFPRNPKRLTFDI